MANVLLAFCSTLHSFYLICNMATFRLVCVSVIFASIYLLIDGILQILTFWVHVPHLFTKCFTRSCDLFDSILFQFASSRVAETLLWPDYV